MNKPLLQTLTLTDRSVGFQFSDVLGLVATLYDRWMQRQNLAELDERMLRDIGISRADVDREAAKPFWRLS